MPTKAIYLYADWCSSCQIIAPFIEQLKTEMEEIEFTKINVDEHPQVAAAFKARNVPTFILFEDGKEISRKSGTISKSELRQFLTSKEWKRL
ncbi:MAG TPA: thioredoxin family protein [Flavobacteriaceae bacterium]|nr:thioredoxin family protein [Flavobacteriaceae bacterium]